MADPWPEKTTQLSVRFRDCQRSTSLGDGSHYPGSSRVALQTRQHQVFRSDEGSSMSGPIEVHEIGLRIVECAWRGNGKSSGQSFVSFVRHPDNLKTLFPES